MRIICVNTGDKFGQWYVDNLKYMIDKYSGLEYDSFEVIEEEKHKGVFNKLQMFDKFRDGENLYFDLDICIYDKVPNLIRKDWIKEGVVIIDVGIFFFKKLVHNFPFPIISWKWFYIFTFCSIDTNFTFFKYH